MDRLRLALKNKEYDADAWEAFYGREIQKKIRERYSLSAELAILRQRDEKPEEFKEYYSFAEQCKEAVKAEIDKEITK